MPAIEKSPPAALNDVSGKYGAPMGRGGLTPPPWMQEKWRGGLKSSPR